MRKTLFFLFFFFSITLSAQESLYDQMKETLSENSLPLVNIIVDIETVNRTDYVAGEIEIADYQHRTDQASTVVKFHCKYRIRGGAASAYEKKSFAVKLIDENGEDLDANILGIREENSWILDAMAIDRIRMRNRVCFDVWNEVDKTPYKTNLDNRNGTLGQFVEVFINGEYNGLYCMTDKIDRKLLGLKKIKVGSGGTTSVKGLLYKGVSWDSGCTLLSYEEADVDKDTWNAWELQYPDDYPSIDTWKPLMDLIDFCSDKTSDETFQNEWGNWFYMDNLLDYVVFTFAMNIGDNAYKNTFLSTVNIQDGHKYLISPWDMDMSLGGNFDGDYFKELANTDRYDIVAPFNRLMAKDIDGFNELLRNKWTENYETLFSPISVAKRFDDYAAQIISSGAWYREVAKWDGNPVPLKKNIYEELSYVKEWYIQNYVSLCNHFKTELPSAINNSMSPEMPKSGVYTLDGRRIDRKVLQKGIYIVNGKKIVKY